jgi:hypothetical protein
MPEGFDVARDIYGAPHDEGHGRGVDLDQNGRWITFPDFRAESGSHHVDCM